VLNYRDKADYREGYCLIRPSCSTIVLNYRDKADYREGYCLIRPSCPTTIVLNYRDKCDNYRDKLSLSRVHRRVGEVKSQVDSE